MRVITACCAAFLLLSLTACPPPDEDGDDAGSSGSDAGTQDDAASGDDAASQGLANGAVCTVDADCESNGCLGLFGVGNAYCSIGCTADPDCAAMADGSNYICMALQTGNRCVRVCDTSGACVGENVCIPNIETGAGPVDFCLDMTGILCDTQDDCAEGACTFMGTGPDIISYCLTEDPGQIPVGDPCDSDDGAGDPCDSTADCPTGLTCNTDYNQCVTAPADSCQGMFCLQQDVCSGPCVADTDCPTGMACQTYDFFVDQWNDDPMDDGYVDIRLCTPFTGSRGACDTDADCSGSERCVMFTDASGTFGTVCREPDSGAVGDGATCGDDPTTEGTEEPTAICASQLCIYSECTTMCTTDADCGDPSQVLCREAGTAGQSFSFCLPGAPCDTDADCSVSGEVCNPTVDLNGLRQQCRPSNGELAPGAACENLALLAADRTCIDDADCTSIDASFFCGFDHQCQPPRAAVCTLGCLSSGTCTEVCTADADCGDTATYYCAGINFVVDSKNTGDPTDDDMVPARFCSWFPGSRTDCSRDADCATAGERCRPFTSPTGVVSTKCGADIPDGVAAGEPCGVVGNAVVQCASDLCDYNDGDLDGRTGTCATPCVDSGDCTSPLTCQPMPVVPDLSVELNFCRKPGAGGISG